MEKINKQVFIRNINKFIKEIENIPQKWFSSENNELRVFVEYLISEGLMVLEDSKWLVNSIKDKYLI